MMHQMTIDEAGKLPPYLQEREDKLTEARENLRLACLDAVRAGERLKEVLKRAQELLDENNS